MVVSRIGVAGALVLCGVAPAAAQLRQPLTCAEDVAVGPAAPGETAAAKPASYPVGKFSLTSSGGLLTLISGGRSDYYECQPLVPRLNDRAPRNAIKCQNGITFIVLDLTKKRFVKAELNPEFVDEVRVSTGLCREIR